MSQKKTMTKREFLSHLGLASGAAVFAMSLGKTSALAQEKRRGAKKEAPAGKDTDLPWVTPGKETAAALAYHHNHADASKDSKTDKKTDKGTAWDQQFCNNCSFYTKVGTKDGIEGGKCTLFQNALVQSKGICNSWAKKT